ncbi:hypothetical protein TRAPUB_1524 [Trametes pubescens]|uniref:Uncharacterized protein n=1 Tax=Trametes pubescens TaxID=154538 RepID=A0A1M2VJ78_TRAPU|nr:hypothetical protein TRAPUB_1524 [Trametes pubescens]
MIHLDHNHAASLPAHANSPNLILANSPHADQSAASPWSSPSRDPRPFYPDSQEHAPPDSSEQPAQDEPQGSPSLPHSAGPGAPTDSQNPLSLSEPSPRSTADARSPPPDSNSSLTPPPDAATPNPATEAPSQPPEDTTDNAGMAEHSGAQGSEEVDKASRQSTPLSELSSAPETAPDDENTGGDAQSNSKDPGADAGDVGTSSSSQQASSSNAGSHHQQNASTRSTASGGEQSASTGGQAPKQGSDGTLSRQHSQASSLSPTHSKAPSLDPKVVSILELNSLLLRYVALQLAGNLDAQCSF